jgi:hypothetical protein
MMLIKEYKRINERLVKYVQVIWYGASAVKYISYMRKLDCCSLAKETGSKLQLSAKDCLFLVRNQIAWNLPLESGTALALIN